MGNSFGGGDRGAFLDVACAVDAALKTLIDGKIASGDPVTGILVRFTASNNYEVTNCASNNEVHGVIKAYEKLSGGGYRVLVRLLKGNRIANVPYGGTLALGNPVVAANALSVTSGSGAGYVLALGVPESGYCDVLF